MSVSDNLRRIQDRIRVASARVGRDANEIMLVAVTKYAPMDAVRELIAAGQRELGESRPQQLIERASELNRADLSWHLIGHLQRNKARRVLPVLSRIHSVDSSRLAAAIDRIAGDLALRPKMLIEVNVSGEESKQGFDADSLRVAWPALVRLANIEITGFMAMAPYSANPEDSRGVFRRLRKLRDELADDGPLPLPDLSMGMSGDFEIAIEEGATVVRVGRGLFW